MLHKTKPGSSDASQIKHAIEKMHGADKIPAKYKNAKPDMYEETDLEEGSYKDGDTTMGTITVNSDEERKKRAAMYRAKKAEKKVKTEETDLEEKYAKATDKEDDGEGLDPVGKGDSDIDNDGDSDSSDRYLKARRKAIAKAMKKEEVEPLDELSQETIKSYYAKAGSQMQKDRQTVQKHMDRKSAPTASSVKKASDAYKRYQKRVKGLNRAADKMHDSDRGRDMESFLEYIGEAAYVIKHKKTKKVLDSFDDYETAKDNFEGLGDAKKDHMLLKTRSAGALKNRVGGGWRMNEEMVAEA